MFLVETMAMAPNCCLVCGKGNTPDGKTGRVGPFLDLAIDYNWGDSGYMCSDCVARAAVLFGWISPDTKKELELHIGRMEKSLHDMEADMDRRRRREKQLKAAVRV
jgi:hypothetical protein